MWEGKLKTKKDLSNIFVFNAFKVFLHPNSAPLWREYLLFTQSYFSNFTVSKVNAAYGKCLSTLSAVRDGSMVSHPALPGTEEDMLGNKSCLSFTHQVIPL